MIPSSTRSGRGDDLARERGDLPGVVQRRALGADLHARPARQPASTSMQTRTGPAGSPPRSRPGARGSRPSRSPARAPGRRPARAAPRGRRSGRRRPGRRQPEPRQPQRLGQREAERAARSPPSSARSAAPARAATSRPAGAAPRPPAQQVGEVGVERVEVDGRERRVQPAVAESSVLERCLEKVHPIGGGYPLRDELECRAGTRDITPNPVRLRADCGAGEPRFGAGVTAPGANRRIMRCSATLSARARQLTP